MDYILNHKQTLIEFIVLLVAIFAAFKIIDTFNSNINKKFQERTSDATIISFMPIIEKLLKILVVFVALATMLQTHGYSITSLIAGFGITGLAVGFGAQVTISNFFGSFSLIADKAFKLGDYIAINQTIQDKPVEGIVEDINLRSTKIRTNSGELIIVPNSIVANGVVKNISQKSNQSSKEI